ncbi:MAG: hypothetical protein PUA69_03560 [Erysipelotrichaceae bacterium]|nr:hypothetical protein [Erysipelotrichaceae bacterium]
MTKDITSGNVPKLLLSFTIPVVLGNLLQLMYNAADSIIVGHFVFAWVNLIGWIVMLLTEVPSLIESTKQQLHY